MNAMEWRQGSSGRYWYETERMIPEGYIDELPSGRYAANIIEVVSNTVPFHTLEAAKRYVEVRVALEQ